MYDCLEVFIQTADAIKIHSLIVTSHTTPFPPIAGCLYLHYHHLSSSILICSSRTAHRQTNLFRHQLWIIYPTLKGKIIRPPSPFWPANYPTVTTLVKIHNIGFNDTRLESKKSQVHSISNGTWMFDSHCGHLRSVLSRSGVPHS